MYFFLHVALKGELSGKLSVEFTVRPACLMSCVSLSPLQSWTHNIPKEREFLVKLVKAGVIQDLTSGICGAGCWCSAPNFQAPGCCTMLNYTCFSIWRGKLEALRAVFPEESSSRHTQWSVWGPDTLPQCCILTHWGNWPLHCIAIFSLS